LFARARRLPRDGRTAWLRRECADRSTLIAEVRALLAQDAGSGGSSFLGTPPGRSARGARVDADQRDELQVTGYSLIRTLEAGAATALYLVRQRRPVQRTCVIKTVKSDADDPPRARARLNAEVRAVAATDHPNVVTLLDAGATRDGRPYLAMQYVHGQPVTPFCDAHGYPLRRRLELFLQACQAVQHVHERGVVHRAVCPDHLLVALHGRAPHLTLVGFGSATMMSEQFPDDPPQRCESSRYAPPERGTFAGRVGPDPRADTYALGVILREMLPPRTPRFARTRLNAIVARATHDDPSQRYQTVDQLAEDVHACVLNQRPRISLPLVASLLTALLVGCAVVVTLLT
jgi:serine/threonine protein kinase